MFFEAMQSYCAPVLTVFIFLAIIWNDTLFEKRVRNLFVCESFIVLIIIAATWADRCLSASSLWQLRTFTTCINFALSPISPLLLMLIYSNKSVRKQSLYFIPMLLNAALCFISPLTGWIYSVSRENEYTRGKLFFVPFAVAAFYLLGMIVFSAKKEQKKVYKREETMVLIVIMLAITTATLLEVIFVKRFMLWSTTEVCVILYFTVLSRQKIKFDALTGVYSRVAYSRRIQEFPSKRDYVIAMADIDGLKNINDTLGHASGDEAISRVAGIISNYCPRTALLYRVGGDEFVLIASKVSQTALCSALDDANLACGMIGGTPLTFSFGVAELLAGEAYDKACALADERLYKHKERNK